MRSIGAEGIEPVHDPAKAMQLADFRALSFGCYGTLIDRDSGIHAALKPLLRAGNLTIKRDEVLAAFTRHEVALQTETPAMPYGRLLAEAHRRLAKDWGVSLSDHAHALFGQSVPQWPVFADVPAALQYLQRFFKLVVLSNVDKESWAGTARRLQVRFDAVFTADEIGSYKPDKRNFDYLIDRLGRMALAPQEILHVAASLSRDQAPASRSGLAFAWIDRPKGAEFRGDPAGLASFGDAPHFRYASVVDMVKAHQEQLLT